MILVTDSVRLFLLITRQLRAKFVDISASVCGNIIESIKFKKMEKLVHF